MATSYAATKTSPDNELTKSSDPISSIRQATHHVDFHSFVATECIIAPKPRKGFPATSLQNLVEYLSVAHHRRLPNVALFDRRILPHRDGNNNPNDTFAVMRVPSSSSGPSLTPNQCEWTPETLSCAFRTEILLLTLLVQIMSKSYLL